MADVLTAEQRQKCMSQIKGKNTKPEQVVRSWLHKNGYRFRIHRADLPGKPDIVLKKFNLIIFVNGCYWHRHPGCRYTTYPATNVEFWTQKFQGNVLRDYRNINSLEHMGWNVLVIWECEVKDGSFARRLDEYFKTHISRTGGKVKDDETEI